MYVLKHKETGKYVAQSGSEHSYTKWLEEARTFKSMEEASANSCPESERALSYDDIIFRKVR